MDILSVLKIVGQPNALGLLAVALRDVSQQGQDVQLGVGQDDIAAREELEVEPVRSVAELEFDDAIGADLSDRGDPPGLEELSQTDDEGTRGGCGSSRKIGQVAAESGVYEELLLAVRLGKLEEEDLGAEIVDVGHAQGDQRLGDLVDDNLGTQVSRAGRCPSCHPLVP